MDFDAVAAGLNQAIPFNRHLGLVVQEVAPGRGVVTLPDDAALHNHVGSQHAGALFSAGEAASVTVFARNARTHNWTVVGSRRTSATGKFTISYRVTHTTQLVAQWRGSGDVNGAGSPTVTIVKKG